MMTGSELRRFRAAVDLAASDIGEAVARAHRRDHDVTAGAVRRHLHSAPLSAVASAHAGGVEAVERSISAAITAFSPTSVSTARDVPSLVRIHLLALLDSAWWSTTPMFTTDEDVRRSDEVLDLRRERREGHVEFDFRVQSDNSVRRVVRAIDRRIAVGRSPRTIGMHLPYARPALVQLLNECARALRSAAPRAPRLWVNSCVRSVDYQRNLRTHGYSAKDDSAHCAGWAADIEMAWMRRRGYENELADIVYDLSDTGRVNVIDEGQAWHLCVAPSARARLENAWNAEYSGQSAGVI